MSNIEITTIKITDIVPARYNPRQITNEEYNKLSHSINQYGLVDPIIINLNNNHIIGGHQRYDILMESYIAGDKDYETLTLIKNGDIGWVFPDEKLKVKDLNHEKSLNIMLNKVQGGWDLDKLQDLFNHLSIEGIDLSLTGFDKEEIKNVFDGIDVSNFGAELTDPLADETVEEDKETSTSREPKTLICPECGFEWQA